MKKKINKYERSIISTLCYSDIFDYPLKFGEVYKYYIGRKASEAKIYSSILNLVSSGLIGRTGDLLYLAGRRKISAIRKRRLKEGIMKWKTAYDASQLIAKIPTVKFVGVSGSLSMDNANYKDDIDLFIIASRNTLWMTRFFVNIFLVAGGIKRDKDDFIATNKICPNMFIAEDNLRIDKNIFTAHEIAQLKVLVNKDYAYEKFVRANKWVEEYMPNALNIPGSIEILSIVSPSPFLPLPKGEGRGEGQDNRLRTKVAGLIDYLFYIPQFMYMKRRITTEKISSNVARFHPQDKTQFVQILHIQRYQFYMKSFSKKGIIQPQNVDFSDIQDTPGY